MSDLRGLAGYAYRKSTFDESNNLWIAGNQFKNALKKVTLSIHSAPNASFEIRCPQKPLSAHSRCWGMDSWVFEALRVLPDNDFVSCGICERILELRDAYLCLKCGRYFCSECTTTSNTTYSDCESVK